MTGGGTIADTGKDGHTGPGVGDTGHGPPVLHVAGESGMLVEFGAIYAPGINRAVMAFDAALRADPTPGVIETVPTIRSVLVRYDPLALAPAALEARLREMLAGRDWYAAPPPPGRKLWRVPAVYGGAAGPDLAEVADLAGLGEAAAVESHAGARQSVLMLGFAPGCAYMGGLGPEWDIPRRTGLTPSVPPGSVLVAIRQTVFPSTEMPTGWRRIATSPFRSFVPGAADPFRLSPGDEVIFEPVTEAEAARLDPGAILPEALE
jgi:KipI family sensor histidine kinase inhibitor